MFIYNLTECDNTLVCSKLDTNGATSSGGCLDEHDENPGTVTNVSFVSWKCWSIEVNVFSIFPCSARITKTLAWVFDCISRLHCELIHTMSLTLIRRSLENTNPPSTWTRPLSKRICADCFLRGFAASNHSHISLYLKHMKARCRRLQVDDVMLTDDLPSPQPHICTLWVEGEWVLNEPQLSAQPCKHNTVLLRTPEFTSDFSTWDWDNRFWFCHSRWGWKELFKIYTVLSHSNNHWPTRTFDSEAEAAFTVIRSQIMQEIVLFN